MRSSGDLELPTGTVTFLFTDIEGSTRLLAELGEGYDAVLGRHAEIMRDSIGAHGGADVGVEGDSFFAAFPSAPEAVATAVDAQRRLAAEPWEGDVAVRVRMGLHTGEARIGPDGYVGMDVHVAARIAAAGHGGQVLLSGTTKALVVPSLPDDVRIRDMGPHDLKDIDEPVELAQLDIDGLPQAFPPIKAGGARRENLPAPLTTFVGRAEEREAVLGLLERHRLVTLTGPGGTGKTRLSLEVGRSVAGRLEGGAWFVDLAPIRDPTLVFVAVARALRINVDPGGDALKAVLSHLRGRDLLLILDNLEQVIEARDSISMLVTEIPGVRVLATSRQALGIPGEQEYQVPPFALDDSVVMFVDRAQAVIPDFALTDANADAVTGIVGHTDGLPLAIELAASQIRVLSPTAMLARLDQRLALPAANRAGPERQRTMADTIAWSHDLLGDGERRLFARLSAFPGGATLAAADALTDDGSAASVLDEIAALVSKSLIHRVESLVDEPRFSMLEPIREFAAARLEEDPSAGDVAERMARYCLGLAEGAAPHLTMRDQASWLDRCDREMPNFRRALDWAAEVGAVDLGLRMATALWRFWQQRGPMQEGRQVIDRLLALDGATPAVRARALGAAGGLAWWSGDFGATRQNYEAALPLVERGEDRHAEAEALYDLGFAHLWAGVLGGDMEADQAAERLGRSLAIAEELDDELSKARALRGLALLRGVVHGDAAGAIPLFRESFALAEAVGDQWEMNESVIGIGNGMRFSGDREGAKRAYLDGIDLMASASNRQAVIGLLLLLTALEGEMGNHERVARLWGGANAVREASGAISPPAAARLIGDPVAAARAAIGDEAVDAGLAEGATFDYDTLVAFAHA